MTAKFGVVTPIRPKAKPNRKLGPSGAKLWSTITEEYDVSDGPGVEMLTLICQALDRAESLREQIDREGEIIDTDKGPREHPGLKLELQNRSFVVRNLQRMGFGDEPIKGVGRPPGSFRRG